jgi:2-dehydropantoate 2-reductase
MRVAVIGPGAVGATFAAAAETAGHEVLLCGRRPQPPITVERPDSSEHRLSGTVLTDPGAIEAPVPWVLLTVKTHRWRARPGGSPR